MEVPDIITYVRHLRIRRWCGDVSNLKKCQVTIFGRNRNITLPHRIDCHDWRVVVPDKGALYPFSDFGWYQIGPWVDYQRRNWWSFARTNMGVAVAVRAMIGTSANRSRKAPRRLYSSRKSCPHSCYVRTQSNQLRRQNLQRYNVPW